jgi:SAM-dependent methyltransferase
MGITKEPITILMALQQNGLLNIQGSNIIELGAQSVHFHDVDMFKSISTLLHLDESVINTFQYNMPAEQMFKAFGCNEYYCIDLDDMGGSIKNLFKWDLNTIQCPDEYKGRFDICTNIGTTEHLFNQSNAFKLMHDLTKVGGIMFFHLPMVDANHGLFGYNPNLFVALARYNEYELMLLSAGFLENPSNLIPYDQLKHSDYRHHSYLYCVLKKTKDTPFVNPSQIYDFGVNKTGII